MKLNPFLYTFYKNNEVALFNSLTLDMAFLRQAEFRQIKANSLFVGNLNYIVYDDFNAEEYFYKYVDKCKQQINNDINCIYINLTSECNFSCKYCLVKQANREEKYMTLEVAKEIIPFLLRNRVLKPMIIFYGGEPLLNFKVMKYIVNQFKNSDIFPAFSLITNGSILSEDIIQFIRENKIFVCVSYDGIFSTKKMRLSENGHTGDKVLDTISKLRSSSIEIGISCTLTNQTDEDFQDIVSVLRRYKISNIGFNPLLDNSYYQQPLKQRLNTIKKAMYYAALLKTKGIYEEHFFQKLFIPLKHKQLYLKNCSAYGKQIVINPSGTINICQSCNLKEYYCDLEVPSIFDTKNIIEHPIWKEWGQKTTFRNSNCKNCPSISICGGGCINENLIKNKPLNSINVNRCSEMEIVLPWLIWEIRKEMIQ